MKLNIEKIFFQISPCDLENILLNHPAVKEVAVVGKPHIADREHPMAAVVLKPGFKISESELVNFLNGNTKKIILKFFFLNIIRFYIYDKKKLFLLKFTCLFY